MPDADFGIGLHAHAERLVLRGQHDLVADGHGLRHEEVAAAAVVEGALAEVLRDLLRHRMDLRVMHRILGKDAREAVHEVVLAEVGSREEFQVQARLAHEGLRHGLVQDHLHQAAAVLGRHPELGHEVVVRVGERNLDEVAFAVHDPVGHGPEDVPLFRGVHQADAAAGGEALAALDDLQASELLIIETAVVQVVVHEHVRPPRLEVAEVVHGQGLGRSRLRQQEGRRSSQAEGQEFTHILDWLLYYLPKVV